MANRKPRPTMVCPLCDGNIDKTQIRRHTRACVALPPIPELVALLDADPRLTAHGISIRFGVGYHFVYKKLARSKWNKQRLTDRGRSARRLNTAQNFMATKQKQKIVETGGRFCYFCGIVDDRDICADCFDRLRRFGNNGAIPSSWAKPIKLATTAGLLPGDDLQEAT